MAHYVLTRSISIAASLLIASALLFAIMQILPGDVAQMILGADVTPDALASLRERLGLNDPPVARYWTWLQEAMQGDFGQSLSIPGFSVGSLIADRAVNSLMLAACASLIIVPVSIALGVWTGLHPNGRADRIISIVSMVSISLPEFASAVFLIIIFSSVLHILPSMSGLDLQRGMLEQWKVFVLPSITLSLISTGYILRMVRASVIEVATSEYVKVARISGVSRARVLLKYVLRNALAPAITIIAMNTGWLIGGLVVVETVFAFPGLGTLLLHAVVQRDVPLMQAAALCSVAAYMLLNFVADILNMLLNPQLRPR
jgi:peptide/nickel transport system permease protein